MGLSEEEIGQRQSAYGKNEISREQKKNPLVLFIRTFINPFIGVLTALAVISLVIDVVMARPEDREWTAVLIIISDKNAPQNVNILRGVYYAFLFY